jgi:hypothetical protein
LGGTYFDVGLKNVLIAFTGEQVLAAFLVNFSCLFIEDNSTSSPKSII